jgi:hypothetical protein
MPSSTSNPEQQQLVRDTARLVTLAELRPFSLAARLLRQPPAESILTIATQLSGIEQRDRGFVVTAQFRMSAAEKAGAPDYVQVNIGILARYDVTGGAPVPSTEVQKAFAQQFGMLHLWPYARVLTHSLTSQLGIPPLMLPIVLLDQMDWRPEPQTDPGDASQPAATRK